VIIAQWNQGTLALAVSSIGLLGAAIATAVGRFNAVNQASEKERISMVLSECHTRAERQDQKIERQALQIGQQEQQIKQQEQQITALQAQVADMGREIERWKVQSETTNSRLSKGNT
jgi:predicted RNase H-like nuclease (RuvC/YqgF family)